MAAGDIVYQVTFSPGVYSLVQAGSAFTRTEVLGDALQGGVDVRDYFTSAPASSKNRTFDSTKQYKVTITEV
jgi:hypothetical protein